VAAVAVVVEAVVVEAVEVEVAEVAEVETVAVVAVEVAELAEVEAVPMVEAVGAAVGAVILEMETRPHIGIQLQGDSLKQQVQADKSQPEAANEAQGVALH
jgi:hypothetical protein